MTRFHKISVLGLLVSVMNGVGCTGTEPEADREGDEPFECEDDADNDGDGYFDCEDSDCFNAPACADSDADSDAEADAEL